MKKLLAAAAALALFMGPAKADVITGTLNLPDLALVGFQSALDDTFTINRTDNTHATITINAVSNAGLDFLFLGAGGLALNVNATGFSASVPIFTQLSGVGFQAPSVQSVGSGQVNGFGQFDYVLNLFNGYDHAVSSISVQLTDLSGTWATAADVLTTVGNGDGLEIAAHIGVCVAPCTQAEGAVVTGFVSATLFQTEVPEPSTLALFGVGLLFLGMFLRGINRYPV